MRLFTTENHLGRIVISREYLGALIGSAAASAFGVVGMNSRSTSVPGSPFRKKDPIDKGVYLKEGRSGLIVELHITVSFGTNIAAIKDSICNKVSFLVEQSAGLIVERVDIFVDEMKV